MWEIQRENRCRLSMLTVKINRVLPASSQVRKPFYVGRKNLLAGDLITILKVSF